MPKEPKHHYVPIFYLRQWAAADGKLIEYCRRYKGVETRLTTPAGTGYVRGLNKLADAPPGYEYVVETKVMSSIDNWAAKALHRLMQEGSAPGKLEPREAIGWYQFLYSLIIRNPEHLKLIKNKLNTLDPRNVLEEIREDYPKMRGPEDPVSFDEYKAAYMFNPVDVPATRVLPVLLGSKRVICALALLKWHTATVNTAKYPLLTSDRPVIMSNGLMRHDAHIVLPISPHRLMIATKDDETFQAITSVPMSELAKTVNNQVAQQAYEFVYGVDDRQLRFVANRLGKRVWSNPLG
jgi:hypothetical protein